MVFIKNILMGLLCAFVAIFNAELAWEIACKGQTQPDIPIIKFGRF